MSTGGQKSHRTALIESQVVACIQLNAAPVGSTDDSVLRWLAAGVTITGPYVTAPDSATDGTLFTITTPGIYTVEFMLVQLASTTILAGVALGGTTGTFTGNPAIGVNSVIATYGPNTLPAATAIGLYASCTFRIRDQDLTGGGNVLRTLCTDGAGATPAAALTEASCWLRLHRLADQAA